MLRRKDLADVPVVESILNMSTHEVSAIRSTGFCYIKISDSGQFFDHITTLKKTAIDLFRSNTEVKKTFTFSKNSDKKIDKILISGYTDRRSRSEYLETFRQDMNDTLLPPFINASEAVNKIKETLVKDIAVSLSRKILNSLIVDGRTSAHYSAALANPTAILTFTYYPSMSCFNRMIAPPGIKAHRDIDLLTVLLIEKPGLEAWMDGQWVPLLPKKGYALVIFGDDFTTLTKGLVRSCLHTVRTTWGEERLSMVCFVAMDRSLPYVLTDGTQLAKTGSEYLDRRYNQHNLEIRWLAKSAFAYLCNKINLGYLFVSSLFCARKLVEKSPLSFNFDDSQGLFGMLFSSVMGFSLINASLKIFSITYFERMILDTLQYSEQPNFATKDKLVAYNLGKKSLSLFGMTSSFFDSTTYIHRSYWNAGFISVFSKKFSNKKLVGDLLHAKNY